MPATRTALPLPSRRGGWSKWKINRLETQSRTLTQGNGDLLDAPIIVKHSLGSECPHLCAWTARLLIRRPSMPCFAVVAVKDISSPQASSLSLRLFNHHLSP